MVSVNFLHQTPKKSRYFQLTKSILTGCLIRENHWYNLRANEFKDYLGLHTNINRRGVREYWEKSTNTEISLIQIAPNSYLEHSIYIFEFQETKLIYTTIFTIFTHYYIYIIKIRF